MNQKHLIIIFYAIFTLASIGCKTVSPTASNDNHENPVPEPTKADSSNDQEDSSYRAAMPALSDIHLGENGELWVLPYAGEKIYYKDTADKWTEFKSSKIGAGGKLDFIDAQNGWLIGSSTDEGELLRTTDAGRTWKSVGNVNKNFDSAYKMKFLDKNNGVILDMFGIWQTADGGKKWSFHELEKSDQRGLFEETGRMCFSDSKHGWVSGNEGNIFKTSDGGKTWKTIAAGEKYRISAIYFLNDKQGWFYQGSLFATTDGGESWKEVANVWKDIGQKLDLDLDVEDIRFINEKEGWLIGTKRPTHDLGNVPITRKVYGGILLHTIDGGITWEESNTGTFTEQVGTPLINILVEKASGKIWLTGWNGVYRSVDNGGKWEKLLTVSKAHIDQ